MRVADLGLILSRLGDAPLGVTMARALLAGDGRAFALLNVGRGDRWALPEGVGGAVLVLSGIATWESDGVRESLGPGHLVVVEAGAGLTVDNDGDEPIVALLMVPEAAAAQVVGGDAAAGSVEAEA